MKKFKLSHIQVIALGFFLMITVGTILLMLPISTIGDTSADFLTSIFTATSASCVTGLVLQDTATYWSTFGQIVIITLIQFGGLGFMTIAMFFTHIIHKRAGLRERALMAESINTENLGGMKRIVRIILFGTLLFESLGAILLSTRFIKIFGFSKGIYYSIFHSISAFCNAGFDLMGSYSGEYSSFTAFSNDTTVNVVLCSLILIGGIGFLVWEDILNNGFKFKRYRLHTKIVLLMSFVLVFGGALFIWIFDRNGICKDMPIKEQILTSLFGAVTARTAGFNTVDTAAISDSSKLLTILLMFVGGNSGSTAGGVKTTSVAVLFIYLMASMRGTNPFCFGRKLQSDALKKAVTVISINLILALIGGFLIATSCNIPILDATFETVSAVSTVGMTTGITRDLNTVSALFTALLMYCGRVGSISFALALLEKRKYVPVSYPEEKITIG